MTWTMTTSMMIGKSVKTHLNFLPAASTAFRSFMLANLSILKSYFCYDDDDPEDHDDGGNDHNYGNFLMLMMMMIKMMMMMRRPT